MSLEKKNNEIMNEDIKQDVVIEETSASSKKPIKNIVISAAIGVAAIVGGAFLLFGGSNKTEVPETTEPTEIIDILEETEPSVTETIPEVIPTEETEPETTETTETTVAETEPVVEPTVKPSSKPTTPTTKPTEPEPEEPTTEPTTEEDSTEPETTEPVDPSDKKTYLASLIKKPTTDREMLAAVIFQEAGWDKACDECRRRVADVVLNRVADSRFPNTIHGVLSQKSQYGRMYWTGVVWPSWANNVYEIYAIERAYRIADEVLAGQHSELYGNGWVWQAEFRQGKEQIYHCGHYFGR